MVTGLIEWAVASRPMQGETECGDGYLVGETPTGILIAVVDGAGHGHEAAQVTDIALRTIDRNKHQTPTEIANHCHQALQLSRGAVLSLAAITHAAMLSWIGVGNVQGRLMRYAGGCHGALLVRPGLIGKGELPRFRPVPLAVRKNDILALVTDGIRGDFECEIDTNLDPGQIAENILAHNGSCDDDALAFIARLSG